MLPNYQPTRLLGSPCYWLCRVRKEANGKSHNRTFSTICSLHINILHSYVATFRSRTIRDLSLKNLFWICKLNCRIFPVMIVICIFLFSILFHFLILDFSKISNQFAFIIFQNLK